MKAIDMLEKKLNELYKSNEDDLVKIYEVVSWAKEVVKEHKNE